MTSSQAPEPQQPTDYTHPLPAAVIGRGTSDGDPNRHLVYDEPAEVTR